MHPVYGIAMEYCGLESLIVLRIYDNDRLRVPDEVGIVTH